MGIEIERKFLVTNDEWKQRVTRSAQMRQGYLGNTGKASVRIRVAGEQAWISIKSANPGMTRMEFEYSVPAAEGREMLGLSQQDLLEKTRYWVQEGAHTWEVDVFGGANLGLVTAELELQSEQEAFDTPSWLGREVTGEICYYNNQLARHPFSLWDQDGKAERDT
jgi:adenylate cyclase